MTAIVTTDDLDPSTLNVVGSKVVAQDPTKAPNVLEGVDPISAVPVQNGDTVLQALSKVQAQINAGGSNSYSSFINGYSSPLVPGTPVYVSAPGVVMPAVGTFSGKRVVAVYSDPENLPPGGSGNFLIEGSLTFDIDTWFPVTGVVGGLHTGARYFLDLNSPGFLRTSVEASGASPGSYLVPVGYALSTTELVLDIQPVIRLA